MRVWCVVDREASKIEFYQFEPNTGKTKATVVSVKLRLHLSFLFGALLAAGSMVMVFFFSTALLNALPMRLQVYSLWLPMPFFFLAGVLAGWGCRGGWKGITTFGLSALLPGFLVPTATMGTQGAVRPIDLLSLTVGVPAATYLITGALGGFASFRSWRGALAVGVGFAVGAMLGPGVAWIARPFTEAVRLPVSLMVWALPWLGGSLGAGWAARASRRALPR